jgi:hypothetical protein
MLHVLGCCPDYFTLANAYLPTFKDSAACLRIAAFHARIDASELGAFERFMQA